MSAKKSKKKQVRESPRGRLDRGAVVGGLAASLVLLAWAGVSLGAIEDAEGQARPQRPPTPSTVPNQGAPQAPVPPPAVEPAYKQAIREAIALGKEGLEDFESAVDWKEDVGGDPFHFANLVQEAGAKVTRAVSALEALRSEAKGDASAQESCDQWIAYFRKKMPSNRK